MAPVNETTTTSAMAGKGEEVLTGTTIIACAFDGGVVLGADSRTSSGSYVANKAADKITKVCDKVSATTNEDDPEVALESRESRGHRAGRAPRAASTDSSPSLCSHRPCVLSISSMTDANALDLRSPSVSVPGLLVQVR